MKCLEYWLILSEVNLGWRYLEFFLPGDSELLSCYVSVLGFGLVGEFVELGLLYILVKITNAFRNAHILLKF
jgi:hypothetical protein